MGEGERMREDGGQGWERERGGGKKNNLTKRNKTKICT